MSWRLLEAGIALLIFILTVEGDCSAASRVPEKIAKSKANTPAEVQLPNGAHKHQCNTRGMLSVN